MDEARDSSLADTSRATFESRPLGVRLVAALSAFILCLVVSGIVAGGLPEPIGRIGAITVLAVSPIAALRGLRIAILANSQAIFIRNYFTSYELKWEEITNIGIGIHHFFGQASAVAFKTRGGRKWVTAQATVAGERECKRVISALAGMRSDLPIQFSE